MSERLLRLLAKISTKKPAVVVLVFLVLVALSIYSAQNIRYEFAHSTYFSKNDPVYQQYTLYQKDFEVGTENAFIFVKADNIFSKECLEYIDKLSKSLKEIDYVSTVISPSSVIKKVIGYISDDELKNREILIKYAPNLVPRGTLGLIIVHVTTKESKKIDVIAQEIERKIEFIPKPSGVHAVQPTGTVMLWHQIKGAINQNMRQTLAASVIIMVLVLFFVFKGVVRTKYVFLPLLVSIIAIIVSQGAMPLLNIPMTEITNGFMPILVGLAIEYAAQFQNRYEEERGEKDVDSSISKSTISTGLAITLAMLTTIIGFSSMYFSGVPALSWLGTLLSIGLVFAFVVTLTLIPSILKLTDKSYSSKKTKKIKKGKIEKYLKRVSDFTSKNPKVILLLTAIVLVAGIYCYLNIKLETNPRNYAPQDLPAIILFKELNRIVGGQLNYILVLETSKIDADLIKKSEELAKYIVTKEDKIEGYESIGSFIKMHNFGKLPESDEELKSLLLKLPESKLKKYLSGDQIAIYFTTGEIDFEEVKKLYNSLKKDVEYFGWSGKYYITGEPVLRMEIGNLIISGQNRMNLIAYIFVILLLLVVYRSIIKAIVPVLAITSVVATMNLVMFLLGMKNTMLTISLGPLIIGLGIDFSIHILERYLEERESNDPINSIRATIEKTGKAITTSALTMAGGFGALMISAFPILRDFGFLSFMAIIFSLVAALTIVPAFLIYTEEIKAKIIKVKIPVISPSRLAR